jgi:hypothetical protein
MSILGHDVGYSLVLLAVVNPETVVAHTARASGYTPTGKEAQPFNNAEYLDVVLARAAGAMRSRACDLCRWLTALFGGA